MRKITITFELDDEPWVDDEGDVYIHDVPTEALDIVIGAIEGGAIGFNRFAEARLDGELLVDGGGHASDEAKGSIRYREFVRLMSDLHDARPLIERMEDPAYESTAF